MLNAVELATLHGLSTMCFGTALWRSASLPIETFVQTILLILLPLSSLSLLCTQNITKRPERSPHFWNSNLSKCATTGPKRSATITQSSISWHFIPSTLLNRSALSCVFWRTDTSRVFLIYLGLNFIFPKRSRSPICLKIEFISKTF